MRLTSKVILIIVISVTSIISVIFYILARRYDIEVQYNQLITARAMYKNILTMRKWVSDYNGVYVDKQPGTAPNPYLPHPIRITSEGDTLLLKNPALVTRELSELSHMMGGEFGFHMASRNFLNPINSPDPFEESALFFFEDSIKAVGKKEFYRIESLNNRTYFRYFAPLYTEESCLTCHSRQGYKVGDLRGGISILLSMDRFEKAKKENLLFISRAAFISIAFLSLLIFVAIRQSVIKPLNDIETAAQKIQNGDYNFHLHLSKKDEIGSLANAFEQMRKKIKTYTNQLKMSEKKYRSLIEHSMEAVAIVRSNGQIIECNNKLSHLTGYQPEVLKSMKFSQLVDMENSKKIHSQFDATLDAGHYETTLYSKDGLEIPVETYTIRGFSLESEKGLSFVYVRDLSERKKIEQYSIQTEKMFALGQMSSGIAHEIRNPLFALNNNLDFLRQKFGHTAEFNEIYPELRNGIDRIHHIVSSILDYAKPHKPEFKPVGISDVINNSLVLVKKKFEKSSIIINTEFNDGNRTIEADRHQLEQVFINLFLNAFQAMRGAGELTVRTNALKAHLEVQVQDTGIGIPEEDINRIFDPFYSKSPNGTGLGLAIVQRILDQHNASYKVKSESGMGTTFFLFIPYRQE